MIFKLAIVEGLTVVALVIGSVLVSRFVFWSLERYMAFVDRREWRTDVRVKASLMISTNHEKSRNLPVDPKSFRAP